MRMTDLKFKAGETYLCIGTENESWFAVGKEYSVNKGGIKDNVGDVWGLKYRHVEPGGDFLFELKTYKTKIDMRNLDGTIDAAKNLAYIEAVGGVFSSSIKQYISNMPFLYLDGSDLTWGSNKEHFNTSARIEVTFEYEYKIDFTIRPKTDKQKLNKSILELEAKLVQARCDLDKL